MDYISKERLGIFLIVISFWYLINLKIFNVLHPILAIPGSTIFITGLWLLLSLPMPTAETSTYIPVETPVEAATQPAEATPIPVSKRQTKTSKKSESKPIRKTKPSKK